MPNHNESYENLIQKVVGWAEQRNDLRAVMVVGSRARKKEPADEWSDLDLILFSRDPSFYLSSEDWVHEFGTVWMTFLEDTAVGGGKERRVLYEDALDIDFSVFHCDTLPILFDDKEALAALRKGFRILVDKDHLLDGLVLSSNEPSSAVSDLPSESVFQENIQDFWYHSVWSAKKLMRGEYWTAKSCVDSYMKHLLLKMTKWHALARNPHNVEIWHEGRFFEKWADESIQRELKECYATYDPTDIAHALQRTMDLYRRVATETANLFGFRYIMRADQEATNWIIQTFNDKGFTL